MTDTPDLPEGHEPTKPIPPLPPAPQSQPGVPPLPPPPAPGYGQTPYGQGGYGAPAYGAPPAWGASPEAPWGVEPGTGAPYSDKQKTMAGLLQLVGSLLGFPGIGHLYVGRTGIGLVQLVGMIVGWFLVCLIIGIPIVIGLAIWGLVDGILMLTGRPVDTYGRPLRP